jgi:integrase
MQALTTEQYKLIIATMREGSGSLRANPRCAAVLVAEANLGMRIGDILRLRLSDIVKDGNRYRLNITEEKTGKKRHFTVPDAIYTFFCDYAKANHIEPTDLLFPIKVRVVQRNLKAVCDLLGLSNISTHSFRKWYATDIYNASGHDIVLVQHLLQHSSPTITRRYIGIEDAKIEQAIAGHVCLV